MNDKNLLLKNLTGKNDETGLKAAKSLIDNADIELYKMLIDKSDFLFPFVRDNVIKRIESAVDKSNFKNIISFFDFYSPYYDDLFAAVLAEHADEELTDEILALLENGSKAQKTFAAKYFAYIPDTAALEILSRYVFLDDENLSANSAEALGQMSDDVSFDIALEMLKSEDDFDKLKAVKFFGAYSVNYPLKEIFSALKTSNMPENIAGQIPYSISLYQLLEKNSEYAENALETVYYIVSGLGEILPLSDIFQFELYKISDKLINWNSAENTLSKETALVLLTMLSKFKLLLSNDEYLFDEDKNTKQETLKIFELLDKQPSDFWSAQKRCAASILDFETSKRKILAVLDLISDYNLQSAAQAAAKLIDNSDETIVYSALKTLKSLKLLDTFNLDISKILSKIQNTNIKALIESLQMPYEKN